MATKNNPPPEAAEQTPTPESIPMPGGGRYRWSDSAPHWVEIDEDGNPVATPVTLGA
jgi:hypothetical protein